MELIKYPNPILSKKSCDVEPGDSDVREVFLLMSQKLYDWNGAGLAAPQVGILKKIVVIDLRDDSHRLYKLINPRIISKSENMVESEEGCLSIPFLREVVVRHESVVVQYFDETFAKQEISATGFFSCCLQHELDHLDGVLYLDRLSRLRKSIAIKKFNNIMTKHNENASL